MSLSQDLEKLGGGKMFSVDLRLLPHGVAGDAIQLIKFSSHIIVMDVKWCTEAYLVMQ